MMPLVWSLNMTFFCFIAVRFPELSIFSHSVQASKCHGMWLQAIKHMHRCVIAVHSMHMHYHHIPLFSSKYIFLKALSLFPRNSLCFLVTFPRKPLCQLHHSQKFLVWLLKYLLLYTHVPSSYLGFLHPLRSLSACWGRDWGPMCLGTCM